MRATATGKTRPAGKPKVIKHVFLADELTKIEEKLGYTFRDKHLLVQALIHRSYLNEVRTDGITHNERLEFLGDAVLEIAVTQFLFKTCTELEAGLLTSVRAAMLDTRANAGYAEQLGLGEHVRLSRGERLCFDRFEKSRLPIAADVFEAILGAMYLDRGVGAVEIFLTEIVFSRLDEILEKKLWMDAKSRLQELSQERYQITPRYTLITEEGPNHDKEFTMAVSLESRQVGLGVGSSKKEAEVAAASDGLANEFGIILGNNHSAVAEAAEE